MSAADFKRDLLTFAGINSAFGTMITRGNVTINGNGSYIKDLASESITSDKITATSFIGDGSQLTGISQGVIPDVLTRDIRGNVVGGTINTQGNTITAGAITATSFIGDGSKLTGISQGVIPDVLVRDIRGNVVGGTINTQGNTIVAGAITSTGIITTNGAVNAGTGAVTAGSATIAGAVTAGSATIAGAVTATSATIGGTTMSNTAINATGKSITSGAITSTGGIITNNGSVNAGTGTVTAGFFVGDGSRVTNVPEGYGLFVADATSRVNSVTSGSVITFTGVSKNKGAVVSMAPFNNGVKIEKAGRYLFSWQIVSEVYAGEETQQLTSELRINNVAQMPSETTGVATRSYRTSSVLLQCNVGDIVTIHPLSNNGSSIILSPGNAPGGVYLRATVDF